MKFTYKKYRGANAKILKDKIDRIDAAGRPHGQVLLQGAVRRLHHDLRQPVQRRRLDRAEGVLPEGRQGRLQEAPIGAGPYRFVKQTAGSDLEVEAFTDYWRKPPSIKTIVFRGIPEVGDPVRGTQDRRGRRGLRDPGRPVRDDAARIPSLRVSAVQGNPTWLEMATFDSPDHPLKDVRVRQAISLAIDRKAINDAELGGTSSIGGNWIPPDWPGALDLPVPPTDIAQAKKLLAEAGVPDGFEVSALTPLPPYFSWGERLVSQLRAINVKTKMNTMERGAFYEQMAPGPNRLKGMQLDVLGRARATPRPASGRARSPAERSRVSPFPRSTSWMKQYDASTDLKERKRLVEMVQQFTLEKYLMIPVCRNVAIWGFGQRLANKLEDVTGSVPQYKYLGPYEDLQLKD